MLRQLLILSLCLCMGYSMFSPGPAKRATDQHVTEIYFVVDRKALEIYEAESTASTASAKLADAKARIKKDIDYFLTQVNILFDSLQGYTSYSVNIQIAKRKLVILDYNIFAASDIISDKKILNADALNTFDKYLENEGAYASLKYDAALLFTGFDLVDGTGSANVAGFAHVGTICGEKATSVVELRGTYRSVPTTAHEIAHILGARHDSDTAGFVMAPTSRPDSKNRWTFSSNSATTIGSVIKGLSTNCLQTKNSASVKPNAKITDDLKDVNRICKRSEETQDSRMCMDSSLYNNAPPKGDAVCKQIHCKVDPLTCRSAYPSDGLVCGIGKSCQKGKCVADSSVVNPNADENCLYGDEGHLTIDKVHYTCESFLKLQPGQCLSESIFMRCCATCKSYQTGIQDCMYGDLDAGCKNHKPTPNFCAANRKVCCYTCKDVGTRKRRSAVPEDVPELQFSLRENDDDEQAAPEDENQPEEPTVA